MSQQSMCEAAGLEGGYALDCSGVEDGEECRYHQGARDQRDGIAPLRCRSRSSHGNRCDKRAGHLDAHETTAGAFGICWANVEPPLSVEFDPQ